MKVASSSSLLAVLALVGGLSTTAKADVTDEVAAPLNEKYGMNIKKIFATKCSWCHQGYGMKRADGPKLAGTTLSQEAVAKQIRSGKSPMPGFKSQLKEEEIQALAEYIRGLPAN